MTSTTVEQDTDDLFSWDTIISYFDDAGDLTSKFIFYDDGTTRDETYFDGVLREVEVVDPSPTSGPEAIKSWQRQNERYDAFGTLEETYQLNDNGIQILGTYEGGVLRLKTEVDYGPGGVTQDAAIWDTRYTYYDTNGVIEQRTETRDDGLVIDTQYEGGIRRFQEMVDLNPDGSQSDARAWDRIETYYDETGVISERIRTDDDGVTTFTGYENGTRRVEFKDDRDASGNSTDARSWDSIETYYDEAGLLSERVQTNDDGVVIFTGYDAGVRRFEAKTDYDQMGNSTDAQSWDSIETYFDESGLLSERVRIDDNGVTTYTSYDAGVRRFEAKTDLDEYGNGTDAKSWESIETFYDASGTITERLEVRDDGTTRYTSYENGTRAIDRYDDRDEMGNSTDARIWESIEVFYDANGKADERFEIRDDGMTIFTDYENGVRSFVEMLDRDEFGFPTDNKSWDAIRKYYGTEGDLQATETVYDNGDITAYFYEDGLKLSRFDLDGDDSESWYTREIIYNPDGTIADTIYDIDPFADPA